MKPRAQEASKSLDQRSRDLRRAILRTLEKGRRGHIASAFSLVEILRVLYDHILRYDPARPDWPERDRFILSKGHGCLALYVLLAEKKFFPERELDLFCTMEGILGGHPEHRIPGVETSTGSLGHGLSIGIGFALNARLEKRPSRTFVVVGDGELGEGSIWEAALSAAKHQLDNLAVIVDHNRMQSYDSTASVTKLDPLVAKWSSFGFHAVEIDGHDVTEIERIFRNCPLTPGKPTAVICNTVKGKGIERIENDLAWHHKSKITDEEMHWLMTELR
jgi:transketolase